MFENHLLVDGKAFAAGKTISAKRPTEYWLTFMKRYVLTYKKRRFRAYYLIFALPLVLALLLFIIGIDFEVIFSALFFSFFVVLFIGVFMAVRYRQALVPITAFHELAKFIISIKGDIYRDRFSMRLNSGIIEEKVNLLDSSKLGLRKRKGTKYKPFELERFKANINLKDGSVCVLSLNQITLRVTTTKRRSSGKTKTKMKRKHKFFHILTLKLKETDYSIFNAGPPIMVTDRFEISLLTENGFHYIKVKAKIKRTDVAYKLKKTDMHKQSLYTEMMTYLTNHKIMTPNTTKTLN